MTTYQGRRVEKERDIDPLGHSALIGHFLLYLPESIFFFFSFI